MSCLTINWHNFAMGWNVLMWFLANLFSLAALSVYNNPIETVKTLSFNTELLIWQFIYY